MSTEAIEVQELPVTFQPALYLQRRGWALDIMRREGVTEVLDIGCGEGELLSCLCNPAPWLAPPVHPHAEHRKALSSPPSSYALSDSVDAEALADLHRGILHPTSIAGLDISTPDLECAVRITKPPTPTPTDPAHEHASWRIGPVRWEPLEVKIWEGSLAQVNPAFIGVECIVATEVIEHLPEDVLRHFAPVLFGAYHPRILLLTTPSYTFNARFTAPDAPSTARSGWRDPTGRTDRIFRHDDHKFEWTIEEFQQWCIPTADEWGYDVEMSGVGKAQEIDEWERDEELGWASHVAAFRRRDGGEWEARRAELWDKSDGLPGTTRAPETHRLIATHQHPAHDAARHPEPLHVVGELVVAKMAYFREQAIPLNELWFEREVEIACGGWVDWLIQAVRVHDGLALQKSLLSPHTHEEWVIQLNPALYHLIPPESRPDTRASPPDTDEVEDPWNSYDSGTWDGNNGSVVVRNADEDAETKLEAWAELDEENGIFAWGEPEIGWGKDAENFATEATETWGTPEGEYSR